MAYKKVKINLPFNIMQMGKWIKLQQNADKMEKHVYEASVVSIFSNISKKEALEVIDYSTMQTAYYNILNELGSYQSQRQEPKKKLTIKGVDYYYEGDLTKLTVAMRMDILMMRKKVFDMPNKLMSILYQSERVTPKEAEIIFSEHFPAKEFAIVWRFFFLKFQRWSNAIEAIQIARMEKLKIIEKLMKMEQRLASATKLQRLFILWRIFSIETSARFRAWCMLNFYTGKILGRKSISWIRNAVRWKR